MDKEAAAEGKREQGDEEKERRVRGQPRTHQEGEGRG